MNPYYKDYSEYLAELFPGEKVQKLSVNAGFSCPNRDGTIGRGGCIYCDNRSFTPRYCDPADSVTQQLEKGKAFFSKKYPQMKYLAYFQSFTGTHASAPEVLERMYEEALKDKDILGVIIGTRPDCLPEDVIDILKRLNEKARVIVEIGAETSFDSTLQLINRCHTWRDVEESIGTLADCGIETGIHLIAGLPGEDEEMIMTTLERVCSLPVSSVKMHQMQVIRGTRMHQMIEKDELRLREFTLEEYLDLCVMIIRLITEKRGRGLAIERFLASAPPEMVVSPRWGLKNYEFSNLLLRELGRS